MSRKNRPNRRCDTSAPGPRRIKLGEVLDRIDDLNEEAAVLFDLSAVLAEFTARDGRAPARRILVDSHWVVPRRQVIARVQRLLAERSVRARATARDLLLMEVQDATQSS